MRERGKYFLDLFGGVGHVTKAILKAGFGARLWDLAVGPQYDVAKPANLKGILQAVRRGKILGGDAGHALYLVVAGAR